MLVYEALIGELPGRAFCPRASRSSPVCSFAWPFPPLPCNRRSPSSSCWAASHSEAGHESFFRRRSRLWLRAMDSSCGLPSPTFGTCRNSGGNIRFNPYHSDWRTRPGRMAIALSPTRHLSSPSWRRKLSSDWSRSRIGERGLTCRGDTIGGQCWRRCTLGGQMISRWLRDSVAPG